MERPAFNSAEEEQFFAEIRERVAFIAQKRIQTEDHEDVIQNTMIELRSRLNDIANGRDLMPFVFETLRNCIRDYYQTKKREEKVLEFSPDRLYYYQSDVSNDGWNEIAEKAISIMKDENSHCAELFQAILSSTGEENLQQKMNLDGVNIYRKLYQCREGLMKIITNILKIPLP